MVPRRIPRQKIRGEIATHTMARLRSTRRSSTGIDGLPKPLAWRQALNTDVRVDLRIENRKKSGTDLVRLRINRSSTSGSEKLPKPLAWIHTHMKDVCVDLRIENRKKSGSEFSARLGLTGSEKALHVARPLGGACHRLAGGGGG